MGAPGPPDILGRSSGIIGFRNLGGGPVGHPQGAQVKTLIFNIKYLPKVSHDEMALELAGYLKAVWPDFCWVGFWGLGGPWGL